VTANGRTTMQVDTIGIKRNGMKQLTNRQKNGRHASRPEKDLIFAPPAKRKNKRTNPALNFLSGFLSLASFSTFASRAFLFVEKITNKNCTGYAKLAKELNPSRKTKTRAKKFAIPNSASWTILCMMSSQNVVWFNDT
ncbi:MAG TPA: hypothetical protein PLS84_09685, partial [Salinivirgaceae bacterium]|nr:hypothetical protein [Salinivirgaceae bacterium]